MENQKKDRLGGGRKISLISNHVSFSALGSQILSLEMCLLLMDDNREISQISFAAGWLYDAKADKEAKSNLWTLLCFILLCLRFALGISLLHFILLTLMMLFVIPGWTLVTSRNSQKAPFSKRLAIFVCLSLFIALASPFFRNFCFIHRCEKEWKGNRCHINAKPLQPPTSSLLQNGGSVKRKKYLSIHSLSVSFYLFPSLLWFCRYLDWVGCRFLAD